MEIREGLLYAKSHEWVKEEGDVVTIGLTDYAQSELGDLVFVNLPEEGDSVSVGEAFGDVESVKAVSDVSPNKLILNVRMKLAAEKLATGKYTVSEVAYDVGYSDPSYFSKVFKFMYNIAPANYLKQRM